MRDCIAMAGRMAAPSELNKEMANGPVGRTDQYVYESTMAWFTSSPAADGASEHYKFGIVEDDAGFRRKTPAEAIEQDTHQGRVEEHPRHVIVTNDSPNGFEGSRGGDRGGARLHASPTPTRSARPSCVSRSRPRAVEDARGAALSRARGHDDAVQGLPQERESPSLLLPALA